MSGFRAVKMERPPVQLAHNPGSGVPDLDPFRDDSPARLSYSERVRVRMFGREASGRPGSRDIHRRAVAPALNSLRRAWRRTARLAADCPRRGGIRATCLDASGATIRRRSLARSRSKPQLRAAPTRHRTKDFARARSTPAVEFRWSGAGSITSDRRSRGSRHPAGGPAAAPGWRARRLTPRTGSE